MELIPSILSFLDFSANKYLNGSYSIIIIYCYGLGNL